MTPTPRRLQWLLFFLLLFSYAFFWQARDWNTSTRLMLTYALVDRGTLQLDGLEIQTGDIAYFQSHYYIDKLPGFSYLATIPYKVFKVVLRLPDHPLKTPKALAHWDSDYWVTLGTSGVATAITAALLLGLAIELGCTPGKAVLVGLAYGLATPAYVYATLAYGHQLSALGLFWAFLLIRDKKPSTGRISWRMVAAGFLASYASVVELQVGPATAILGLYVVALCVMRKRPTKELSAFVVGALTPTAGLLVYNQLAFGSPFDMGYFHHATKQFAEVHNKANPLGLLSPNWSLTLPLLASTYRGLLFYAPILILAFPGWLALVAVRRWADVAISLAISIALFLVNLSYPEWTGGWSTGPRFLLPLIPFAMIPVAGLLAAEGTRLRLVAALAIALTAVGFALNTMFVSVGGRIPHPVADPFFEVVGPLWIGRNIPQWWIGDRFCRNLVNTRYSERLDELSSGWQLIQFVPLLAFQATGLLALLGLARRLKLTQAGSNLVVDHEEQSRGRDENARDPETEPQGVTQDPGPGLVP